MGAFEYSGGRSSVNHVMNDNTVCRTALATLGVKQTMWCVKINIGCFKITLGYVQIIIEDTKHTFGFSNPDQ